MKDLEAKDIPTGVNIKLYVTDTSCLADNGVISCIANDHLNDYIELNRLVENYCANVSDGIYCPREEETCLVKCDSTWYRAVGLEMVGDGEPTVILIDVGNVVKVPVANIRKMPRQLAGPVVTRFCRLKGLNLVVPILNFFVN